MSLVNFSELVTANNKKIACCELNSPKSLNALSLTMIDLLLTQLRTWQSDNRIVMVIIQGVGDKAFCAGGDVVSLYHALKSEKYTHELPISDKRISKSLAQDFFSKEYQLDQLIHEYSKPLLVWGNGYIMGGGIGLFAGASHRVVTENSLLAMPEITIGLYPDVGASWFLNKMPNNIGVFLGLTGAIINAVDALDIGLANVAIKHNVKNELLQTLTTIAWQNNQHDFTLLDNALHYFTVQSLATFETIPTNIKKHKDILEKLTDFDNGIDTYNAILALDTDNNWLQKAQSTLKKGSPLSAMIIYRQLTITKGLSLAQCFSAELNLSLRCCQYPEFSEGVRALLVDKDKQPKWAYKHVSEVPEALLNWFFTPLVSKS